MPWFKSEPDAPKPSTKEGIDILRFPKFFKDEWVWVKCNNLATDDCEYFSAEVTSVKILSGYCINGRYQYIVLDEVKSSAYVVHEYDIIGKVEEE